MAGDWIKFELATLDKPEVCQIADLAGIDSDAVVGKLLRIWGWFDQQTPDGNAPSVTKRLLDRLVGVSGFCDHMQSVGWMEEADGVISLPHFERHNGKTAKQRLLTAKRVAAHKAANAKGNAASVSAELAEALPREDVEKIQKAKPSVVGAAPASPKARATRLPADWTLPDDLREWALAERPELSGEIDRIAASFKDYWCAKSGKDATKVDWSATWRNWVRNQKAPAGVVRPFTGHPRHNGLNEIDHTIGLIDRGDGTYDF